MSLNFGNRTKEVGKIENDLLTFKDAIAIVENYFWRPKDRRGNERINGHPTHEESWNRTYNNYYKHLPQDKIVNLKDIITALNRWQQRSKSYKDAM